MSPMESKYLQLSLECLGKWLPLSLDEMMTYYKNNPADFSVSKIGNSLHACIFSYPVDDLPMEQLILLVFDEIDRVIADTNAYHMKVKDFLTSVKIYDYLSEESDWMYLEHYVISGTMFPELPYPFCESNSEIEGYEGEVLLYGNAYVSIDFRRKGIFKEMLEMVRDHAIRCCMGKVTVYSILSMDPDVPCYGPDSSDEPYIYTFEKDEPKRKINEIIAKHVGFTPLRLEELDPENISGTKLWFCIKEENDMIIEIENT